MASIIAFRLWAIVVANVVYRLGPSAKLLPLFALYLAIPALLVLDRRRAAGWTSVIAGGGAIALASLLWLKILWSASTGWDLVRGLPAYGILWVLQGTLGSLGHMSLFLAGLGLLRNWRPRFAGALSFVLLAGTTTASIAVARSVPFWPKSPERQMSVAGERTGHALNELRRARRCLRNDLTSSGGYPRDLAAIAQCVGPELAGDRLPGYKVAYAPGGTSTDGRSSSYSLRLSSTDPKVPWVQYAIDQTGAIRMGPESQTAAPQFVRSEMQWIEMLDICIEGFRHRHPEKGYPSQAELATDLCLRGSDAMNETYSALRTGELDGYRFIYTTPDADASERRESFRLDIRPVLFGPAFKTSYMCDPLGKLRATDEDRSAEHTDRNLEHDVTLDEDRPHACLGKARFAAPAPGR